MATHALLTLPGSGYPADPVVARIAAHPGVQKVPSPKLTLFIRKHFIPPELCTALIARIDASRRPSEVSATYGDDAFRTSETCDFVDADDIAAAELKARIVDFTGMDPAHGEPMQGQRYAVGQEFKAHTDYFEPSHESYQRFCNVAGQRTWTVMLYLNAVEAGGATRFKAIDKIIQPEPGKLLAWNNLRADGRGNPATLHHAMKVRGGHKYVITQWFREKPWGWA